MKMSGLLKISVLLAAAVLVIAALLGFIYSGFYNIAASEGHFQVTRWVLETTMRNSIERHAAGVELSPIYLEASLEQGFRHYEQVCIMCHGAPGIKPKKWARGMLPEPPNLSDAVENWTPEQIYWISTNGLKMTGMPAIGGPDYAEDRWAVTAFIKENLTQMSEAEYAGLQEKFTGGGTAAEDLVARGEQVFQKECAVCHFPERTEIKVGPGLQGLFERELTPVEEVPVNEENIRQRIRTGGEKMPSYSHIQGKDLEALMAYLQTL